MDLLTQKLTELGGKITNSNSQVTRVLKDSNKNSEDRSYLSSQVAQSWREIEQKATIKNTSVFLICICCPYTSKKWNFHSMKTNIELKKKEEIFI